MEAGGAGTTGKPFRLPDANIGGLKAEAAAALVAETADIALVLDGSGQILDISLGVEFTDSSVGDWVGRNFIDTVTMESRQKVADLLHSAGSGPGRWRHINHILNDGQDLPVRYRVLKLGDSGHFLAFGQDQRSLASLQQRLVEAQQTVEREYSRLRLAETRYRLMFQMTDEPVVIVEAETAKIVEFNPAAEHLMDTSARQLDGKPLLTFFDNESRARLEAYFVKLRTEGTAPPIKCCITGADRTVSVSGSVFRQGSKALILLRLIDGEASTGDASGKVELSALIENLPDAFVVTDANHFVLSANTAFLDLTQLVSPEQLRGQSLDQWLGRTEVDFKVLMNTLKEKGAVRRYATAIRGELGATEEIEASVVAVHRGDAQIYGFVFRQVPGVGSVAPSRGDPDLHRSVEKLTELVGRVPLKDIVRETTDMIERMCIEAALDLTNDNRASAADVLGLSRQSLYVKLRRFGIRDFKVDTGDD